MIRREQHLRVYIFVCMYVYIIYIYILYAAASFLSQDTCSDSSLDVMCCCAMYFSTWKAARDYLQETARSVPYAEKVSFLMAAMAEAPVSFRMSRFLACSVLL
jgi:hypothetical protein